MTENTLTIDQDPDNEYERFVIDRELDKADRLEQLENRYADQISDGYGH